MDFKLDPPSGYADSYFDVEFIVHLKASEKASIKFYNDTSEEHLEIIGTSNGYILNSNTLVVKNTSLARGHINIFNNDKMNKTFSRFPYVTIKCEIIYDDVVTESESVAFYNESQSIDAEVIPFDMIIHNPSINLLDNEPLLIDVISGSPRRYEFCIKSESGAKEALFEVSTKIGKTSLSIPSEILRYDLDIKPGNLNKFQIHYVKFQGSNFSRIANRKYIPIDNTELTFEISGTVCPQPQNRQNPLGGRYSEDFMISDRYLVLCPKEYSGFSKKTEYSREKLMDLTLLLHEAQHMETLAKEIRQFATTGNEEGKIKNTEQAIQKSRIQQKATLPRISVNQLQLMKSISGVYDTISTSHAKPDVQKRVLSSMTGSQTSQFQAVPKKSGCLPCSRKRKKNA